MTKEKRALTTDDFTNIAVYSDPQVSPNGSTYAFVSTTVNEEKEYISHLYLQSLQEKTLTQWTFGNEKNSHPRFSPDGSQLVFQSNRSGTPQLWLMNINGGEAKQLTTFKHGATNPVWTNDGTKIIFTSMLDNDDDVKTQAELTKEEKEKLREEKEKQPLIVNELKYKSDAQGFHDEKRSQLIMYDLENDTLTQLTKGQAHHSFQDISPDDKYILFSANLNEEADYELTNDLYFLNTSTLEIEQLTNGNGGYQSAHFSPSGDKIACLGHEYEFSGATLNELYIFNVQSKERTCWSSNWDFQLGDAMIGDMRLGMSETGPVWSKDEKYLYFIGTDSGATGLYQVDLDGELTALYREDTHVFGFSYDKSKNAFILGMSTPTNPCDFYLLENESKLTRLTEANQSFLDEVALSTPEPLIVTAEDGWEVQGWLLKPYGFEEGKKYPFVLEVHGGPHAMYGQTFFHELQLLAAKGYVVLYTNPRGSHGYGQKFVDAVRADYGGKDYTDLMSAVDYVIEQYSFIDETRLGVTGGSYGGFMTNWIVGHTDRFKAAVTQRSICNWLSFYGVSDIGYFFTKWELGHHLLEDPKKLWEFSPLKYVENVKTPLLILHGELDFRCPIEQGEQLFIALKHLRKNVEFVRFPGANHELSRSGHPDMRIERLNHIVHWFEKHL
ncbi:S9 family peptidase [Virgibacillus sp. MSJ-26]|uniref:S9 family peptidase n=1 Tax=Virgibacillus sp. MSJ-26 TaxID=2841522 RepID=UPI001C0FC89E|nr:S9 family peptidase [Virgibacillus sp. MSJ-26]MBU5465643.1 S9 family peptidase [Virgibacillus sp. MSJ-26]